MPTQVYAVVHDGQGNFLLAIKNTLGYFFHTAEGGDIIPAGQPLNGGGSYVFPGGRLEHGTPPEGAAQEFLEETAVGIAQAQLQPPPYHGGQTQALDYYGVYFQIAPADLDALANTVQNHLDIGSRAANAVIDHTYGVGQYAALMEDFPGSPADNELDSSLIWNLNADWEEIQQWQDSQTLGWFYLILLNLRNPG